MQFITEITHLRQEVSTSRLGVIGQHHSVRLLVVLTFKRDRDTGDGTETHGWRLKTEEKCGVPFPVI